MLEARTESRVYAGLKPGTTSDDLRRALTDGTIVDDLECFTPKAGDSARYSLPFRGAGANADATARTQRDRGQRRVPQGH